MTKRIVKEPTIGKIIAQCPVCLCEFEFDAPDAKWRVNEFSRTIMRLHFRVVCPCCNTEIENHIDRALS